MMINKKEMLLNIAKYFINISIFNSKFRVKIIKQFFKNISIGEDVSIRKNVTLYGNGKCKIGNNSFVNEEVFLDLSGTLIIGDNVAIGMRSCILSSSHNIENIRCGNVKRLKTIIGNNVWIGAHVVIYPGVIIGDGCVIAAGEVVRESIPKNKLLKMGILRDIDID